MAAKHKFQNIKKERKVILHPNDTHKYSLIWLHGLGDSAYGFTDIF